MKRHLVIIVLAVLALMAGAPFLRADRFGPRIQAGLESALGRKVEIGSVRVHLLTGPGFSVRNVVIHERPEISAEPFAYVDDLVVRVRILSLLSGKLEFSSLRLDKPHVNLMRHANGAWNVRALLAPPPATSSGPSTAGAPMPELEVRRGRLNFKIDDRKSAYYFTDADIDFSAVGDGNFDIWFVGEIARTDRMARGLGRVTARGRLRETEGEPRINLDARLERSALQELAQLLGPRDLGIHGVVQSRAEISGPVSGLEIKGQLELTELHHWTQPPRAAAVKVAYTGSLQLGAQKLRLESDAKQPLRVTVDLENYLTNPRWQVDIVAGQLGLDPMAEWLRPPGSDFNGMKLAGTLTGQVTISSGQPATGAASLTGLDWTWGDGNRLEAAELDGEWKDGVIRMAPAALELDGQPLQVDCGWTLGELSWQCRGSNKGHDIKKLQRWMKALGLRAEWVEDLTAGQIRGSLSVAQVGMEPLQWKGQLELRNAELPLPELAQPFKIAAATVVWQQERLVIPALRASSGPISWAGSYRYELGAVRPHRILMDTDTVELADLERLLGPLWRNRGFFSRAIGMDEKKQSGAAEIEWKAKRVGLLENVRATFFREGEKVTIPSITGQWQMGKLKAAGSLRIGGDIDVSGTIAALPWEGGVAESEWRLTGRIPLTIRGTAKLTGGPADGLSATYRWDTNGRVEIASADAAIDGRKIPARITGPADGPLLVEFPDALKIRVTGKPFAVAVEGR